MSRDGKEITLTLDPVDFAALEIEARRRGMAVDDVASERFVEALTDKIERTKKVFLGDLNRPSKGLN